MLWYERRVYEIVNMTTPKRPFRLESVRVRLSISKRLRDFKVS